MADFCEQGSAAAEWHLKAALSKSSNTDASGGIEIIDCCNCGEEIPEQRRRAVPGCRLCITCKTLEEKNGR